MSDTTTMTAEEILELKEKIHILTESQMKLENTVGELAEENARLKELLKECKTRMTDCLYKLYDEGGQSYPNLDEELKSLLTKIEETLK